MKQKVLPHSMTSELIFGNAENSYKITKLVKEKKARKLASKIYTENLEEDPRVLIKRNLLPIIKAFFPGAIISHRSALETRPTPDGFFFVTYKRTGQLKLPGLTIITLKSDMKLAGTSSFMGDDLHISRRERAFLENLQQGKTTSGPIKILGQEEIEKKLDQICRINGEEALNEIRDNAKMISLKTGLKKEFAKLNKIISAILSTHPASVLVSSVAKARSLQLAYDPERIERFNILADYLRNNEFPVKKRVFKTNKEFENQCFFEAYFSNYIEGTQFEIAEAVKIVFEGSLPKNRPDAHDILGNYQLLINKAQMKTSIKDASQLITTLKLQHHHLMQGHPHIRPGSFKEERNQAGSTLFVEPEAVQGTLIKGMENFYLLLDPFKQSLYLMFLISEVHPFADGNGRLARLIMNSVLYQNDLEKIIVPNVFRDDYMGSLKKLTKQNDPSSYVKAMVRCHEFSATINYSTFDRAKEDFTKAHAFLEPNEAKLIF
jgi:fido (protein-threonine AMPylation protein)